MEDQKKSNKKLIAWTLGVVLAIGVVGAGTYLALTYVPSSNISSAETTEDGSLVLVDGVNKISKGGEYTVTGSVNGSIKIETDAEVTLVLNNVSLTTEDGPAIWVESAEKVTIKLVGENKIVSTPTDEMKGAIYSRDDLEITGDGSLDIESKLGGVYANDDLTVSGGTITISAEKKAFRVHDEANFTGGKITVAKCSEGIEAVTINISGGDLDLTASDDGLNAVNSDGSDQIGVGGDASLNISGGTLKVNASGDGLDSNGNITISGGTTYVDGPTNAGNGALDYDGTMTISGGTLIAVGSSGMAMNASSADQPSVLINLSQSYSGEFSFAGITYKPSKSYQSILISSDKISTGKSYDLKIDNKTVTSVTVSQNITGEGSSMGGGGGRGGMMQRQDSSNSNNSTSNNPQRTFRQRQPQ